MADTPAKLTQDDLDFLNQKYGNVFGLKAGDPITFLVPSYSKITAGLEDVSAADPIRDKLVAGGYLTQGADVQGNQGWTPGGSYYDAMAAFQQAHPGNEFQSFAPSGGFGSYSGAWSSPYLPKALQSLGNVLSDAKKSSFSGVQLGEIDPITGMQIADWSKAQPHIQAGSSFDRMLGPLLGAGLMMGAGGLGIGMGQAMGLGQWGPALFNQLGRYMLNQESPVPTGNQNLLPIVSILARYGLGG